MPIRLPRPVIEEFTGLSVTPRRHVENISSLILGESRGATLGVPCWNQPSLYNEPRTDYYILSSSVTHVWDSSRTYLGLLSGNTCLALTCLVDH